MTAWSLNDAVHGRIVSDQRVRSIVLQLVEKYGFSCEQKEMLLNFSERLVSILRAVSLPREKESRKQKLSAELASVLASVEREGEPFGEAFHELLSAFTGEISDIFI